MITITHSCDKCKKIVQTKEELWELSVCERWMGSKYNSSAIIASQQYCRGCYQSVHKTLFPREDIVVVEMPKKGFEELFRELVVSIIEENQHE